MTLIIAAGLGQLLLAAGSLAIPRVLKWSEQLRSVRPLTRQVFWTYAGYIWTTNVCFGLMSVTMPGELLAGTPLAVTACVERITTDEPAGVRMIAIVLALLYGMKAIVGVEAGAALPPWRWLGFCLLWFGMRPGLFARAGSDPRRGARALLIQGL